MTGAPPVPPRRSIHHAAVLMDEKNVQMISLKRDNVPPPVPHRGNYNIYPQSIHAEHENMPHVHHAAVLMHERKHQMVPHMRVEIPPPVPHRGNNDTYPQVSHTEKENIHHIAAVMHDMKPQMFLHSGEEIPPPVPHRGNYEDYPQVAKTEQENRPPVPPRNDRHDAPPVPPPHNSALHDQNGHPAPYPLHYFPYPPHMYPWYGAPHPSAYEMPQLPMAPSEYLELGSTPPPVPYGTHMSAYYTPQNSAMKSEATTSGESGGSIYNPHTDSMVPGYENITPYRPVDVACRPKEEVYSGPRLSSEEPRSPSPNSNNRVYVKRAAYSCAQCRKRKTILGEDRGGKLICRKCCEADDNYVGVIKRSSVTPRATPRRTESEKTFVCTSCHSNRERRHFFNGELVCRACYYSKTKREDAKGYERKCDNCNIKQKPDLKVYNRSKFNEVLCHNCFHYKLRNGVSRPLDCSTTISSKL